MLTARAEEVDRIVGLELGADDYVVKPFSPRELVLRIRAILRRIEGRDEEEVAQIVAGPLAIDLVGCQVQIDSDPVDLTATEFKLLTTLAQRRGRVQSRGELLKVVWGYEYIGYSRTVDTHIRRLREKLGTAAAMVETVRGMGYRFRRERTIKMRFGWILLLSNALSGRARLVECANVALALVLAALWTGVPNLVMGPRRPPAGGAIAPARRSSPRQLRLGWRCSIPSWRVP